MWEVDIDYLYRNFDNPNTLEILLLALVKDRKSYGYPMAKIYSMKDMYGQVKLCVCEYPEDEPALKKSPHAKKLFLVYEGQIKKIPNYLNDEYARVTGRPLKSKKWWQFWK